MLSSQKKGSRRSPELYKQQKDSLEGGSAPAPPIAQGERLQRQKKQSSKGWGLSNGGLRLSC